MAPNADSSSVMRGKVLATRMMKVQAMDAATHSMPNDIMMKGGVKGRAMAFLNRSDSLSMAKC